uniref:Serine protease n=1 Tax=Candidatus Kentrum sp. LFY TaxID=2126342 RepID=A0A450V4Q4_9GAMM|nr:MAG: glutamyl endopeptidase [Candidatus Kentron sp. LFY]
MKSKSSSSWASVKLVTDSLRRGGKLELEDKCDSVDSSRLLVRGDRFRNSYMMATNGGATYEDLLYTWPPTSQRIAILDREEPFDGIDAGNELQNVLGGRDERVLITDTSRIPVRSIGLLKILPEGGVYRYGTAWLIGPRTLATAAHNLLHPEAGPTRKLHVGMGYDGTTARGGWYTVIDNSFPHSWKDSPTGGSPYDFAVLKIEDSNVGNKFGWFGYSDYEDEKFGGMILNLFGYPLDRKKYHMYGVKGRVVDVDAGRIFYDCDAWGGMSGGPVIARFGQQRIAVGIHAAGGILSNVGTRINNAAFALFEKYRNW